MASSYQVDSTRPKRKRSDSEDSSTKIIKPNSLVNLIKHNDCDVDSKKEFETLVTTFNVDVDYSDDSEDYTPLRCAVQKRSLDWTKLLLQYGADQTLASIEHKDGSITTVADTAWLNDDCNIVLELLLNDGAFPQNFNADKLTMDQKLKIKVVCLRTNKLHKQIENDSFKDISIFTESNPKIKYAYNISNKSALTTALEFKRFKVYAFLRSKGFACGIDDEHNTLLIKLETQDKNTLDSEIQEYFKSADLHILNLLSKSRLGMNNDKAHFEKLKTFFEKLDEIEEVRPILKIIASEKNFSMIFDFEREDIGNLDPVGYQPNRNYTVRGRTFREQKKILIAAKQRSENEILGILSQELTHFALLKVFENDFLPYRKKNWAQEDEFTAVIIVCLERKDKEEIIAAAFQYGKEEEISADLIAQLPLAQNTPKKLLKIQKKIAVLQYKKEKKISAELIARVPQLLAQNTPEKLSENQKTFETLFSFFDTHVAKQFELEVSLIEKKQNVQELNKTLGFLHRLKTEKMRCSDNKFDILGVTNDIGNIFVKSELPDLLLSYIIQFGDLNDFENIFVELEQLTIESNLVSIKASCDETFKPAVFVTDSKGEENSIAALLDKLGKCKIVFISSGSLAVTQEPFKSYPEVNFTFSDLMQPSKNEILNSMVDFQDFNVELRVVLGDDLEEIECWNLKDVFDALKLKLNHFERFFPKLSEVYVPRSFLTDDSKILSRDDVVEQLEQKKTIIISDVAGMGKTTSAVHLAKALKTKNQLSWIVFFDLKQHTDLFEKEKNVRSADLHLVLEKMLRFEKEIERKLFKRFLENAKSIFVIDGFDEISPRYNNLVVRLIQSVQKYENRVLITTRTYSEGELTSELGSELMPPTVLKLLPFTEDNQIDFLLSFWSQTSGPFDVTDKPRQILERFKTRLVQKGTLLENPLQLFMLAELASANPGSVNIDFTLFSLYEHFVTNKLSIWIGTPLAKSDVTSIVNEEFNVLLFHRKIAFESFYGKKSTASLQLPQIPNSLSKEIFCRIGFLQIDLNGDLQFNHQTFADYFMTQFFLKSLTTEHFTNDFNVLHDLLLSILIGSSHYDENIRKFFDEKLEADEELFHTEKITQKFEQILATESNCGFLIGLIEKSQYNIINFVLLGLQLNKETKMKVLKYKNATLFNALHVATANFVSWKLLWSCIESFTNESERKEILYIRGGCHERSILQMSRDSTVEHYEFVKEIHDSLWDHDDMLIASLLRTPKMLQSEDKWLSPAQVLWDSIEQNLKPEHQKQLLFRNPDFGLFIDLLASAEGTPIALNAARNLFTPQELNKLLVETNWLCNEKSQFNSVNRKAIQDLFQEFIESNYKKVNVAELRTVTQKERMERPSSAEHSIVSKTLNALSTFIERNNLKTSNAKKLRACIAQVFVQVSANQSDDLFSLFWTFVDKVFDKNDQKRLLLFEYKSMNTLVALTSNRNKSTLAYVRETLLNLFESKDLQTALNADDEWLINTFNRYACLANSEAFKMFLTFLQEKLNATNLKMAFLHKDDEGFNVIMSCGENNDSATLEIILSTAKGLLNPDDFEEALKSEDQSWLVNAFFNHAANAEFRNFSIFWSFLKENLTKDCQKLLFLQNNRNGDNLFMGSAVNSDQSTVEYIINAARDLLSPHDFKLALESGDQNWVVSALGQYAYFAEAKSFSIFWSFLLKNLPDKNNQKLLFLQKSQDGSNLLKSAAQNKDAPTIKIVINIARELLNAKDFASALKSVDQNWLIEASCQFARFANCEVFSLFWLLLKDNLTEDEQKLLFLQKDEEELNVIESTAENKDKSAVKLIIDKARDLLNVEDFTSALKSENENWVVDTLCRFVFFENFDGFSIFWSLLEENLDMDDKKMLFLQNNEEGRNVFLTSAWTRDKSALKLIINIARDLLQADDFELALKSDEQNWLIDASCQLASFAESESFSMFWSFLKYNLSEKNLKLLFLKVDQDGNNVFKSSAENKDKSTVKKVINIARKLLNGNDLKTTLESEEQSWLVDTLCQYSSFAELETFSLFWSFLQENLPSKNSQKLLFLKKNRVGSNVFRGLAQNEDASTVKFIINTARDLLHADDFETNLNFFVDALCHICSFAKYETFSIFWSFLQENLNKADQKYVFLQKIPFGLNATTASAQNNDGFTIRHVINAARELFDVDDFASALKSKDQNWLVDTLCQFTCTSKPKDFEMFWSFLEETLDQEKLKTNFLQKDQKNKNAFMYCAENRDINTVDLVIDKVRELFDRDDFIKSLSSGKQNWVVDSLSNFALTAKVDAFKIFWSFMEENFDREQRKSLLLQKDHFGSNALMRSAFNKDIETLKVVLELSRSLCSESDIHDFLFFIFWYNQSRENFDQFDISFDVSDFPNCLKKNYGDRNLIWFLTFGIDHDSSVALWNLTLEHLQPHEIKKQQLATDQDGDNAITNAAFYNRLILMHFLEWLRENASKVDFKKLFEEKHSESDTLLHIVALNCGEKLIQSYLEFITASLTETEIKQALLIRNGKNMIPLETSRSNKFDIVEIFNQFHRKYLYNV